MAGIYRCLMNDYAKDGGKEHLLRSIAFFNRILIESSKIRHSNAMRLRKNRPFSYSTKEPGSRVIVHLYTRVSID